jgi:hypothetical protein
MAKSPLIRTLVNNGKGIRFFNFDALTGQFVDRLLKIKSIGNIEISDPELETKLTNEQLATLRAKYPYLAPKVRKAEPLPLKPFENAIAEAIEESNDTEPQTEPAKRGRKPKQA